MRGGKYESCVDEGVRARMLCNFASPDLIENPYAQNTIEYLGFDFGVWVESDRNVKICRCCKSIIDPYKAEKHHVILKSMIKRGQKRSRRIASKNPFLNRRIFVCIECHREIHDRLDRYPRFVRDIEKRLAQVQNIEGFLSLRTYVMKFAVVNHVKRSNSC